MLFQINDLRNPRAFLDLKFIQFKQGVVASWHFTFWYLVSKMWDNFEKLNLISSKTVCFALEIHLFKYYTIVSSKIT